MTETQDNPDDLPEGDEPDHDETRKRPKPEEGDVGLPDVEEDARKR